MNFFLASSIIESGRFCCQHRIATEKKVTVKSTNVCVGLLQSLIYYFHRDKAILHIPSRDTLLLLKCT